MPYIHENPFEAYSRLRVKLLQANCREVRYQNQILRDVIMSNLSRIKNTDIQRNTFQNRFSYDPVISAAINTQMCVEQLTRIIQIVEALSAKADTLMQPHTTKVKVQKKRRKTQTETIQSYYMSDEDKAVNQLQQNLAVYTRQNRQLRRFVHRNIRYAMNKLHDMYVETTIKQDELKEQYQNFMKQCELANETPELRDKLTQMRTDINTYPTLLRIVSDAKADLARIVSAYNIITRFRY